MKFQCSDERLHQLYVVEKKSTRKIAAILGVTRPTVSRHLRQAGIQPRLPNSPYACRIGKPANISLDKATLEKLYFDDYLSLKEIAARYDVSRQVINRLLREYNIPTRRQVARKYKFNEKFFSSWSPNMAYILGLIYADGCLLDGSIFISSQNEEYLKQIASVMSFDKPPIHGPYSPSGTCDLYIRSLIVYDDLTRIGLTPRKSLTMIFPDIPDDIFGDFVHGFFDGDGSVCKCNHARTIYASFSSGSRCFIEILESKLRKHGLSQRKLYTRKNVNIWTILYGAKADNLKLYDLMYSSNCTLCLARKKAVFDTFMALFNLPLQHA